MRLRARDPLHVKQIRILEYSTKQQKTARLTHHSQSPQTRYITSIFHSKNQMDTLKKRVQVQDATYHLYLYQLESHNPNVQAPIQYPCASQNQSLTKDDSPEYP